MRLFWLFTDSDAAFLKSGTSKFFKHLFSFFRARILLTPDLQAAVSRIKIKFPTWERKLRHSNLVKQNRQGWALRLNAERVVPGTAAGISRNLPMRRNVSPPSSSLYVVSASGLDFRKRKLRKGLLLRLRLRDLPRVSEARKPRAPLCSLAVLLRRDSRAVAR
jgi:hypothetical protein